MKEYWATKKGKRTIFLVMIPIIVILNYLTGLVAYSMRIPFFMDTWATSLGVMVAGLPVGIAGGMLYNIIMSLTVWPLEWWVFCLSNAWVAVITYLLFKAGWIKLSNPLKLLVSGVAIGITNALVVILLHLFFFGLTSTYEASAPAYRFIYDLTNNQFIAIFFEKMITEISDKLVSIFMAVMVLEYIPFYMRLNKISKKGDKQ
jgi:energy-coupling factor transport system substrate-specific component